MKGATKQADFQGTPIELLGKYNKETQNDLTIVKYARYGVNPIIFFDLLALTTKNKEQFADYVFSTNLKTLTKYKRENKNLSPRNGETALKLVVLYKKGIEVFGDLENFNRWLDLPAFGLNLQIPYEMMNTITGIDLIVDELVRIEYGDLA